MISAVSQISRELKVKKRDEIDDDTASSLQSQELCRLK
jgi:hypothetical protein